MAERLSPERLAEIRTFLAGKDDWVYPLPASYGNALLSHGNALLSHIDALKEDRERGWIVYGFLVKDEDGRHTFIDTPEQARKTLGAFPVFTPMPKDTDNAES